MSSHVEYNFEIYHGYNLQIYKYKKEVFSFVNLK